MAKRKNPSLAATLKRDVWVPAKVMVTKGGKILAKVAGSLAKKANPRKGIRVHPALAAAKLQGLTRPKLVRSGGSVYITTADGESYIWNFRTSRLNKR